MPHVEIIYCGLIRTTTARHSENYELAENATLRDLLLEIVRRHGDVVERYLFSEDHSQLASGATVLRDGGIVQRSLDAIVCGGEKIRVLVMSPMMIGG